MPNLREAIDQASKKLATDLEAAAREWVMGKVFEESAAPPKKAVVRKEKKKVTAAATAATPAPAKEPAYVIKAENGCQEFHLVDGDGEHIATRARARDLSTVAKRKGYEIQKNKV